MPTHARRLRLEPLEDRRVLATIVVDTLLDNTTPSDGLTTLREALAEADDLDTIEFSSSIVGTTPRVVLLTEGPLEVESAVTISGPGAELLTIDASGNDTAPEIIGFGGTTVFDVNRSSFDILPVVISGLTLTGGDTSGRGGAVDTTSPVEIVDSVLTNNHAVNNGGAISSTKRLTLTRTTIEQNATQAFGGAIYAEDFLTLIDSHVVDNQAHNSGGAIHLVSGQLNATGGEISRNTVPLGQDGGGVHATNSPIVINGTMVMDNAAGRSGGAFYLNGGRLTSIESTLAGNHANGDSGGAIYAQSALNVFFIDSTVNDNSALVRGGAVFANFLTTVSVTGTTFDNNRAGSQGGAIYVKNLTSTLYLADSLVLNNSAGSQGGGLMADENSKFQISGSTIAGNHSNSGGGIHAYRTSVSSVGESLLVGNTADYGGAMSIREATNLEFTRSTIHGNHSTGDGGGIATSGVDITLSQSTMTGNRADSDRDGQGSGGGVIAYDGARISLTGSIAAGNQDSGVGPDVYLFPNFDRPTVLVYYSLLGTNVGTELVETAPGVPTGIGGLIGGATNGPIDPRLGPLSDNGGLTRTRALLPGSPALDAGDPNVPFVIDHFDQRGDGYLRVVDGGGGLRIDIGAYESQAAPDRCLPATTIRTVWLARPTTPCGAMRVAALWPWGPAPMVAAMAPSTRSTTNYGANTSETFSLRQARASRRRSPLWSLRNEVPGARRRTHRRRRAPPRPQPPPTMPRCCCCLNQRVHENLLPTPNGPPRFRPRPKESSGTTLPRLRRSFWMLEPIAGRCSRPF